MAGPGYVDVADVADAADAADGRCNASEGQPEAR